MSVTLRPETERLIQLKISSGNYGTPDEVIAEALRLLDERDKRVDRMRRSVVEGFRAVELGGGIPFSEELIGELGERVEQRVQRDDQPHPDVCP